MLLPSLLAAMRGRRRAVLALSGVLLAAAVGGCGSSTTTSSVSTVTRSGLHYSVNLTVKDGQACVMQTYAGTGAKRRPLHQTSRYCGPSGQAAPPMLIQVAQPAAVLILDRPASCAPVQVGRGQGPLTPANATCSATAPHVRVTILPLGRTLVVMGIPGVRTIPLSRFACAFLCTRQLAIQR